MKKTIVFVTALFTLALGMTTVSHAATINKMSVTISAPEPELDGFTEPQISAGGNNYEVTGVEWKNNVERWRIGSKQQAVVTLTPEEGYSFSGFAAKKNWSVYGGEFVKCKRGDEGDILLTISYGPPKLKLAPPENPGWDREQVGVARWEKVKNASAYEVRVFVNDESARTLQSNTTRADLTAYMRVDDDVRFDVRAVAANSEESGYLVASEWASGSDEFYYGRAEIGTAGGTWIDRGNGWAYQREDSAYITSQWELILGNWYYFNQDSLRSTGWNYINDKWYFFDENGVMQIGWRLINGDWYYLQQDGAMAKGWCQAEPGKWYFLYEDGKMAKSTTIDGYYLNDTGLWIG